MLWMWISLSSAGPARVWGPVTLFATFCPPCVIARVTLSYGYLAVLWPWQMLGHVVMLMDLRTGSACCKVFSEWQWHQINTSQFKFLLLVFQHYHPRLGYAVCFVVLVFVVVFFKSGSAFGPDQFLCIMGSVKGIQGRKTNTLAM